MIKHYSEMVNKRSLRANTSVMVYTPGALMACVRESIWY